MLVAFLLWSYLSTFARAEIRLYSPAPFCAAVAQAAVNGAPGLKSYQVYAETPRLILVAEPKRGQAKPNRFEVYDKNTGRRLGSVGMEPSRLNYTSFFKPQLDPRAYVGHLPVFFDRNQGKGYGTEGKYAAMKYGFDVEKMAAMVAVVDVNNASSIGLHEKLGFRVITRTRDTITYGITKEEFNVTRRKFARETEDVFLPRRR